MMMHELILFMLLVLLEFEISHLHQIIDSKGSNSAFSFQDLIFTFWTTITFNLVFLT